MSQRHYTSSPPQSSPPTVVAVSPDMFGYCIQCGDSKICIPKELLPDLAQAVCTWLPLRLDQLAEIKELIRYALGSALPDEEKPI